MTTRKLDANHDMVFGGGKGSFHQGVNEVSQNVETRLYHLKGEWFLDIDDGVPYVQELLEKPIDLTFALATIKDRIITTAGVTSLTNFSAVVDTNTRKLFIVANVSTIYNEPATIRVSL